MKRSICLIVILGLLVTFVPTVFAAQEDELSPTPRLVAISLCDADININEDTGIASCEAQCLAQSTDYTVKAICRLQRRSGATWVTLRTWSNTDTYLAVVFENWAINRGYTYRVYATFYVYDENGTLLEEYSTYDYQSYM
jgi:hypothetical protein